MISGSHVLATFPRFPEALRGTILGVVAIAGISFAPSVLHAQNFELPKDDVPLQAPGGSRCRWFIGATGGSLDAIGDEANHADAHSGYLDFGSVGGFQTIRLLRYGYVAHTRTQSFPTQRRVPPIHELSALYRLYLMPDHWAGPLVQIGPKFILARGAHPPHESQYKPFGGLTLGTGFYMHLSPYLSTRFEVTFDRYNTGRMFSHDAAWSRVLAIGADVAVGAPQ